MAKIIRATQKIFGENATTAAITTFGTAKTNDPNNSRDPADLQTASYSTGWESSLEADYAPFVEDTNGLCYLITRQLAYIYQQGTPEWDSGTTYYENSLCTVVEDGNLVMKRSLENNNYGNDPVGDNGTHWADYYSNKVLHTIGEPIITFDSVLDSLTETWLDGKAVPRPSTGDTTYAALWNIYGTTFGAGDGSTTFNLPNFIGRTIWGADSLTSPYLSAGLPNIKGNARFRTLTSFKDITNPTNGALKNSSVVNGLSGFGDTMRSDSNIYIDFDASKSNAIYGKSNTVQPAAIKVRVKTRFK